MKYKEFAELIMLGTAIGLVTLKDLLDFAACHGVESKTELLTALRVEYKKRLNRALCMEA